MAHEVGFRSIICVYPGVKHWMEHNDMNMSMLARRMDIPLNTVWSNLSGRTEPSMFAIRKILEVTGMTFEQAFGEQITPEEARKERW